MQILYIDESGTINSQKHKIYVLAGVVVTFEQKREIEEALEKIVAKTGHNNPKELELHGNVMFSGRSWWRHKSRGERLEIIKECLVATCEIINDRFYYIKAIKEINKPELKKELFELADGFNQKLKKENVTGLIISDRLSFENEFQKNSKGQFSNVIEVPLFMDSQNSRLIQLADMIAYAWFRAYESDDYQFYDLCKQYLFK